MPCHDCIEAARALVPAWVRLAPLALFAAGLVVTLASGLLSAWLAGRRLRRLPPGAHWTEHARLVWPLRVQAMGAALFMPVVAGLLQGLVAGGFHQPVELRVVLAVALTFAAASVVHARVRRHLRPASLGARLRSTTCVLLVYGGLSLAPLLAWTLPARPTLASTPWLVLGALGCTFFAAGGGVLLARALGLFAPASPRLAAALATAAEGLRVRPRAAFEAPLLQANALAFPLLRLVVVTRPALAQLSDDELAAVCRHELEHLEEPRAVLLLRTLTALAWTLGLASSRIVAARWGVEGVLVAAGVLALLSIALRFVGRRMEARADRGGHEHGPAYAHALEKLHAWNLIPAVLARRGLHGHLYDRIVAAGVTPDYPRPAPPPATRARFGLLPGVALAAGVTFAHTMAIQRRAPSEANDLLAIALRGDAQDLVALAERRIEGRVDDAITLYAAAEALDPGEPAYPATLAYLLPLRGACAEARAAAERARNIPGAERRARALLGSAEEITQFCEEGVAVDLDDLE